MIPKHARKDLDNLIETTTSSDRWLLVVYKMLIFRVDSIIMLAALGRYQRLGVGFDDPRHAVPLEEHGKHFRVGLGICGFFEGLHGFDGFV